MAERDIGRNEPEDDFAAWLAFWLQFLVLAVVAVAGLFFASADRSPGDYGIGLGLAIAAAALAALRLKMSLDGDARGFAELILVDEVSALWFVIPIFTVLAFAGILLAHAYRSGDLYWAGIALFLASVAIIFLDTKRVFDRIDAGKKD